MTHESPCISPTLVRRALNALCYSATVPAPNPLTDLALVDEFLGDPDLPCSSQERDYALAEVLSTLITDEYQRCQTGVTSLPPDAAREAGQPAEAWAIPVGHPALIGWSWLYYHFVRVDLQVTIDQFCHWAGMDARTLRRYQGYAIDRLTAVLIAAERQTRISRRKRQLYATLPVAERLPLYGREQSLGQCRRAWQTGGPRHLYITGAAGAGKTALVQALVRAQIEAETVDYLVWVQQPETVTAVRDCLAQILRMQRTRGSLREYAARYELVVVLDGLEGLLGDWEDLETLLDDLSTEQVALVDRVYRPLRPLTTYVEVPPLKREPGLQFLQDLLAGALAAGTLQEADLVHIWETTGGSPQAMRQAVEALRGAGF